MNSYIKPLFLGLMFLAFDHQNICMEQHDDIQTFADNFENEFDRAFDDFKLNLNFREGENVARISLDIQEVHMFATKLADFNDIDSFDDMKSYVRVVLELQGCEDKFVTFVIHALDSLGIDEVTEGVAQMQKMQKLVRIIKNKQIDNSFIAWKNAIRDFVLENVEILINDDASIDDLLA